jgi:ABC transport system ATP-binding/permease protein
VMLITHDREFLDAVVTRILELDRGQLRSYPGNFSAYERLKEDQIASEGLANARADKLLAQEEIWIRRGVEARRTRSVSRIQRLQDLRSQRSQRREVLGQVKLDVDAGTQSGRVVAELKDVGMRFGEQTLITDFTATILRGDKVGLIGPNGVGKTTLLKIILGELEPTSGHVRQGKRLQVAYFDQMRSALNLNATLADTISPGSEWVEFNGSRKHVMSYLSDFLFSPERSQAPVSTLSGGERNRLLLARLFALPANVLVLDEPTNDLDIDTLELLEELLQSYGGTVFLVSHDRRFLDNVVTSTIAWEGEQSTGFWREYEGGYQDWQVQKARAAQVAAAPTPSTPSKSASSSSPSAKSAAAPPSTSVPTAASPARVKLSYKDQRELDGLPAKIEALEAEQKQLAEWLSTPDAYTQDPQRATEGHARCTQIDEELLAALTRWEILGSGKAG